MALGLLDLKSPNDFMCYSMPYALMHKLKIAGHFCFINQGSGADTMAYCNKVENLVKPRELGNKHYGAQSQKNILEGGMRGKLSDAPAGVAPGKAPSVASQPDCIHQALATRTVEEALNSRETQDKWHNNVNVKKISETQ